MIYDSHMSTTHDSSIHCPVCSGQLKPRLLHCKNCDIQVEGNFTFNEFANLNPEDLHFLRIFIRSEGRIRDMETALGLSYPTIRTRLTALKEKLAVEETSSHQSEPTEVKEILEELSSGKLSFDQALESIKKTKNQRNPQ